MNRQILATMLGILALAQFARADIFIDDFNDNDAIAVWDGPGLGSQWGDPTRTLPGVGNRLRVVGDAFGYSEGIGGVSNGYLTITDNLRLGDGGNGGNGMLASDRVPATQKFEAIFAALVRDPGGAAPTFDATGENYIRFTAWLDPSTGISYLQSGTAFYAALTSPGAVPNVPFASVGPYRDPDGVGPLDFQLVGVPITTTPTAFLVSFSEMFPDFVLADFIEAVSGPGFYDEAHKEEINGLEFGFRRAGDYPIDPQNPNLLIHPDFHIDDVMLLKRRPAVFASPLSTILNEAIPGDTVTINVSLSAQPTGDVTVTALSSDPTEGTTDGPFLFTPANYSVPQPLTVTVVDDVDDDGNVPFEISFTSTGDDLYYNSLAASSIALVTADDDATVDPAPTPAPNFTGDAVGDFDGTGCVDLEDFLILLDNWQLDVHGNFIDIADFLVLLDNWLIGPNCP